MRGDAPKGQGGVRITNRCFIYSPRPRFASATPPINEGGKKIRQENFSCRVYSFLFLRCDGLQAALQVEFLGQRSDAGVEEAGFVGLVLAVGLQGVCQLE